MTKASRKIPLPILSPFNSQDIPLDPKFIEGHIDVGSKFSTYFLKCFIACSFFLFYSVTNQYPKRPYNPTADFYT